MKKIKNILPFIALLFCLTSCIDNDQELMEFHYEDYELMEGVLNISQEGPPSYTFEYPSYYGRTGNFDKNLATLGRVMFYDEKLSADGKVSCASCHKQEIAFSDDKALSDGIDNQVTKRNSLALGAVFNFQEYYGPNRVPFFWDNSISTVQDQIVTTFGSKNEMDMTIPQIVKVMNDNDYYQPLINRAYNTKKITEATAVEALAVFVNSMGSYSSRFDEALSEEAKNTGFGQVTQIATINFKDFSEAENRGKSTYMEACASCHGEIMGAPNELQANNGLSISANDYGVASTQGQFKVPSLRNLSLTGPYMHDGRFESIDDVLDHYSAGIEMSSDLHPFLRDESAGPRKFNFSTEERDDLLAFFKTLDDPAFLVDPKYSDPFIR